MASRQQGPRRTPREKDYLSPAARWLVRLYTDRLTPAGQWFLWPTLAFLWLGSVSLVYQHFVLFCYAAGVWVAAWAALVVRRPKARLTIHHAERVCAGARLPVEAEVEWRGWLAARDLRVTPLHLPFGMSTFPADGAPVPRLRRGERAKVRLEVSADRRGVHTLPGFRLDTDFPFGLLRNWRVFREPRGLVVYPRYHPLVSLELPMGRRYQPGGVAMASFLGDSTEYLGSRELREGDNVRHLDWRATARLQKPIVREYREEYYLRAAVVLDTHLGGARRGALARWGLAGLRGRDEGCREDFERAVSVTAAVADYLARQNYIVDLLAAGGDLYHLTAGRSLAYLDQILDLLACVEENPREPFEALAAELSTHLSRLSAVVCVFLDWTESRRNFSEELRREGVGLKIVVVNRGRCTLDPRGEQGFGPITVLDQSAGEGVDAL